MLTKPLLLTLLLPTLALAGPTTKPSTTQSTWAALAAGEVRYTEPAGWTPVPLPNANDLTAAYKSPEGTSLITVHVNVQQQPIPNTPAIAQSLGQQILKAIKADLVKSKAEILEEPKLEKDPRFMVRIHDKVKINGITTERLQLYRSMGYTLVRVSIGADNQTPDQAKSAFSTGEQLLDTAVLGPRTHKGPSTRPTPHTTTPRPLRHPRSSS